MGQLLAFLAGLSAPCVLGHGIPAPSSTFQITASTTLPIVCTSSATATWFATTGCDTPCPSIANCISDLPVTVPCGCDRVSVAVRTTTLCPTKSPCVQCYTGWGIATLRLPCPIKPSTLPTWTQTV